MAKVQVNNVVVLDNPSPFYNPFQFEITFECIEDLSEDLEWKIIYVGSAESEEYDQVLDSVLVGPVPAGRHMFVFQVRLILVNIFLNRLYSLIRVLLLSNCVNSLCFCCIHLSLLPSWFSHCRDCTSWFYILRNAHVIIYFREMHSRQ